MGLIGCHVSIANGVDKAPARGADLGCEVIQLFTTNQMQWKGIPITEDQAQNFKDSLKRHKIKKVIAHDGYLINLASPDPGKLALSRKAFTEEIKRCEQLGIYWLVFHPGSHMGKGLDYGISLIAESLDMAVESSADPKVKFLVETTAGQGTNIGSRFEELKAIIERCSYPERIGVCFDTCHVFAAGYDIISEESYERTIQDFDRVLGLERLLCIHLNDSKRECGSRVDRHANLGEGVIGWEVFFRIVNDPRFSNLPMILETPGDDNNMVKEIKTLKAARGSYKTIEA